MREVDPVLALKKFVAKHPNQRAAAAELGISQAYLNDILNKRRDGGEKLLARLGLKRIVVKA